MQQIKKNALTSTSTSRTPRLRYTCFLHRKHTELSAPSENVMKVLIIGRGVVGTIYGWALSKAGIDVTYVQIIGNRTISQDQISAVTKTIIVLGRWQNTVYSYAMCATRASKTRRTKNEHLQQGGKPS
jgi:hypothetical protein